MKEWIWAAGAAALVVTVAAAQGQDTRPAEGESAAGGPLHVVAMTTDRAGNVWVGSEGQGVWRRDGHGWKQWTKAAPDAGPGDEFAYAVACDLAGRVWVGTATHGVSVFNGQQWKTYNTWGPSVGPSGQHVTALAVNPKDGDVWIGSDAGVTRYSQQGDRWKQYGRAENRGGLPADQVRGIGCAANGDVYLATACAGVVIGREADGYTHWEQVKGPTPGEGVPLVWTGTGLPTAETNCVAVDDKWGQTHVYVGTPLGLAVSADAGRTWRFWRGKDWAAEARGSYDGVPAGWEPGDAERGGAGLMSEDWVTCLTVDGDGMLWVGHRTTGYERIDPKNGEVVVERDAAPMGGDGKPVVNLVRGLAMDAGGKVMVGRYLSGATLCAGVTVSPMTLNQNLRIEDLPPLPRGAAAPEVAELQEWEAQLAALPAAAGAGAGEEDYGGYIGEDWVTGGDWVGHVGRQMAKLGGWNIYEVPEVYAGSVAVGGHWGNTGPYTYTHAVDVQSRRALISPLDGRRAETELNDGSFSDELSSLALEGPDLWAKVNIPEGPHRVSAYMMNPDGQTGRNALRDFVVELRRDDRVSGVAGSRDLTSAQDLSADDRIALEKLPVVARGRASGTWNGVYEQFVVNRPGLYWVKVVRNHSFVGKLFGVFVDRIGPEQMTAVHASWVLAEADPPATQTDARVAGSEREVEARKLWAAAEAAWGRPGAEKVVRPAEMAAYRAAEAEKVDPDVLALWRWKLGLWSAEDRGVFDEAIAAGAAKLRERNR